MPPRRILKLACFTALVLLVADQAVNWLALDDGRLLGRRIAPFDPPLFNAEQDASLARLRATAAGDAEQGRHGAVRWDAEIGWTNPRGEQAGDSYYDVLGARRAAPCDPGPERRPRLLLLGCSFVHGDEVPAAETFAARLESASGWLVFNCGVGGYGIDQALLRLRREGKAAESREVWLGLLPKALLRLLSHYRPALRHHEPSVSFKPRFRLAPGGALELLPNPAPTPARAVELLTKEGAFFAAVGAQDYFVAEHAAAYAPLRSRMAHWSAAGRIALTAIESAPRPLVEDLLADETTELFQLSRAIVRETAAEAARLSARFRLLVLPDADDVARAARDGVPPLARWREVLSRDGIEIVDLTPSLVAAGARGGGPPFFRPGGHWSGQGCEVVAAALGPLLPAVR